MYILEVASGEYLKTEIVRASYKDMPGKKDGWSFNWRSIVQRKNARTYILRRRFQKPIVQGILHLKETDGMLLLDLVEIAPHNMGTKGKKYDRVAGILLAFACKESFKLDSEYQGFLTFKSKSELIELYQIRYGAKLAFGQNMYFEPQAGQKLIAKYLNYEIE